MNVQKEIKDLKENLKENFKKELENNSKDLNKKAEKMIDEFFIPLFKKIGEKQSSNTKLKIHITREEGLSNKWILRYEDEEGKKKLLLYELDVFYKAIELLKDSEIEIEEKADYYTADYYFLLDLEK